MNRAITADQRPNILILTVHDLGRHLRCYDAELSPTPALDRLASDGVVFENHFSTCPLCSPARASIMTGRYPHANGMNGLTHRGFRLRDHERCIPDFLNDLGYQTALIGLQHEACRNEISRLGYSEVLPTTDGNNFCTDVARETCRFLERGHSKPFFLSVGFFEIHREFTQPHVAPMSPSSVKVPPYLTGCPEVREDLAAFYGMIQAADRAVAAILDSLDKTGLAEDTLLLFTTDHGAAFPRAKSTLYDAGIGVTFIARRPGTVPHAERARGLTSHVDILPTILELTGQPIPDTLQGRSFLTLLRNPARPGRESIFAEKSWHGNEYDPMRCVRTDRYKYIRNFKEGWLYQMPLDVKMAPSGRVMEPLRRAMRPTVELYDLRTDAMEMANLAGLPAYGQIEGDLRARLARWMADTGDPLPESDVPWPQPGAECYPNNMLCPMPTESKTLRCGG